MRIAKRLIDEMVEHAFADLPNECCGMVGGSDDEASVVIPVVNSAASPLRFEMDPQGQYNALKAIEDDGKEMLAIYHSHTKSAAYPSQTDVNQAVNWPDAIYLIVSLQDEDAPEVKGYWLKDLAIADAELIVE
ncbi:MAG TPA: M67 family metallopeptidase [Solirubrobacterales bacterium]|nr:M67 family metallopeptidase [Solirubrobacterales bacterium]